MPAVLNYPGVYIEEVRSAVRTITGVATSITAFVGRARRGPMDDDADGRSPVRIRSFADYERIFGGLWEDAPMSFSVAQYFQNGGSEALIVRVGDGTQEVATGTFDTLTLNAANPGRWGGEIEVLIDHADGMGGTLAEPLFNLVVRDRATDLREVYFGLSTSPAHPRHVVRVLRNSALVRADIVDDADRPGEVTTATALTAADTADGGPVDATHITDLGLAATRQGIYALDNADLFNLLVIPPFAPGVDVTETDVGGVLDYVRDRRAMWLLDTPELTLAVDDVIAFANAVGRDPNMALFFPRLRAPNPLRNNALEAFAPSGAVAGVIARTDAARGVWKAPAGIEAALTGAPALAVKLTDGENGDLNPLGINCLRDFPVYGRIVWGARTLAGADALASEWKYLPVRRMALFLEESLYRGTQWVVFEPNDEPLWAQIRLNLGAFMQNLFRQGAFQGRTPREAYFVKCDAETTTQNDIDLGIVNILVGFAPLKPAEFVVIRLQQIAGNVAA